MENLRKSDFNQKNALRDFIVNDPETTIRIGLKEIEKMVSDENKANKINAPLTVEEKSYLSL